jgi:hypothetical protein
LISLAAVYAQNALELRTASALFPRRSATTLVESLLNRIPKALLKNAFFIRVEAHEVGDRTRVLRTRSCGDGGGKGAESCTMFSFGCFLGP